MQPPRDGMSPFGGISYSSPHFSWCSSHFSPSHQGILPVQVWLLLHPGSSIPTKTSPVPCPSEILSFFPGFHFRKRLRDHFGAFLVVPTLFQSPNLGTARCCSTDSQQPQQLWGQKYPRISLQQLQWKLSMERSHPEKPQREQSPTQRLPFAASLSVCISPGPPRSSALVVLRCHPAKVQHNLCAQENLMLFGLLNSLRRQKSNP